jgi:ribosomal-protein-serine acetyltransferase
MKPLQDLPDEIRYDDGSRALRMRRARSADAEMLIEAFEESVPELRAFLPWSHFPQSVEQQRVRLTEIEEGRGPKGVNPFHILDSSGERLLGCLGWNTSRTLNSRAAEIGYWMRTSAAGQGLMTLATQCMVVVGFEVLHMERIQCGYNVANLGSKRVCDKVGFHESRRFRLFQEQPTVETRRQGYIAEPDNILCALFHDDPPRLDWYEQVRSSLTVLDPEGSPLWTPQA